MKYLFISVKPEFARKIAGGTKTIELRKSKPNVQAGDKIVVYATKVYASYFVSSQCVMAIGTIKQVLETSPDEMWWQHSEKLGIDREDFDAYFGNKNKAVGIELTNVSSTAGATLEDIRRIIPGFQPPQSYFYLTKEQFEAINEIDYPF